jgi:hypothetical protein
MEASRAATGIEEVLQTIIVLFHEQVLWLETFAQSLPAKIERLFQQQRDVDIHEAISE